MTFATPDFSQNNVFPSGTATSGPSPSPSPSGIPGLPPSIGPGPGPGPSPKPTHCWPPGHCP